LSKLIRKDAPPPSGELYSLRMKLTSGLVRHLKTEDWLLYPPLVGSNDERVAVTARVFSTEMGGLASDYKAYANRWGAGAIEMDWKGYQRETADILRALALRMAREERDLYPLLEPAALERLPSG
jgi:hypothetical protein